MYNKTQVLRNLYADIELFKYYYEEYDAKKETKVFNNFYKLYIEKVLFENTKNFIKESGEIMYISEIGEVFKFNNESNKFEDSELQPKKKRKNNGDFIIDYYVKNHVFKIKEIKDKKDTNFSETSNVPKITLQKLLKKINKDDYNNECNNEDSFFYKKNKSCIKIDTKLVAKLYLIREGIVSKNINILY